MSLENSPRLTFGMLMNGTGTMNIGEPLFIVGRETWSWGWGFRVYWRLIDYNDEIHFIESDGQLHLDIQNPNEWFSKLNIRVVGSTKCNDFIKLNELLCKINMKPLVELYDRNYLGSANSVMYVIANNNTWLLECHGSNYYTKNSNNDVNTLVSKVYKIVEFPADF